MERRKTLLLALVLVVGAVLRAPFLIARHGEGDERDAQALVAQLSRGAYSLRDAPEINRAKRRAAYVDAPIYHHPPLFYLLGWPPAQLAGTRGLYLVGYLASLAVLGLAFALGARLRDAATGLLAAAIVLLCPATQLIAGKIWAESTLSALLLWLIYALYGAARASEPPSRRKLLAFFALGAALTLTRHTGVFALGFLLPMLLAAPHPRALRPLVLAAAGGLFAGVLAWFAVTAAVTGHALTGAAAHTRDQAGLVGFVAMLMQRNPASFFYVPLLLCPLYVFAFGVLRPGASVRPVRPLVLFVLGYAAGLTLLTTLTSVTFHMKYVAPALPALAVAAAWQLAPLLRARPWLGAALALAAVVYAAPMLYQLTITLPAMAEVDPRFFYPVFDAFVPW